MISPSAATVPWPLNKVIKPRGGCGYSEVVDGRNTTTCEEFEVFGQHISRHLIAKCTCSFCQPYSVKSCTKLPQPGRFEIHVPPADNRWKWTSITWRWGVWQYYVKVDRQLFPSRPPYFDPAKWA